MSQFLALYDQNNIGESILTTRDAIDAHGGVLKQIWNGAAIMGKGNPQLQSELLNIPGLSLFNGDRQPDFQLMDISKTAKDLAEGWLLSQTPDLQNAWNNFWNGNIAGEAVLPADNCGGGVDPAAEQMPVPFSVNGLLGFVGNQQMVGQL